MEPYRVPFLFDRSRAPRYRLVNMSAERVRGVTLSLAGPGVMASSTPRALAPAESLDVTVRGDDLAVATTLIVRWVRPDGADYLWRVAF
jgi:hypothetical protein